MDYHIQLSFYVALPNAEIMSGYTAVGVLDAMRAKLNASSWVRKLSADASD